jgi:multidrug efflux pump subunit AcrA (membrane-fusion protein)
MKRAVVTIVALLAIGVALAAGWWYLNENPEWIPWMQEEAEAAIQELGLGPQPEPKGLLASGFIEAEEAMVSTELGGRIVAIHADEGDEVTEGHVVVELDDSLLLAQIGVVESEVAIEEATLAHVKAGAREETLNHARALVAQAEAAQAATQVALENAQAMLENPQELNLAIIEAQGQAGVLSRQEKQAQALADSAQAARDLSDEMVKFLETFEPETIRIGPRKIRIALSSDMLPSALHEQARATYQSWEAWTALAQAEAALSGAEGYLSALKRQQANPLALEAQVSSAESQLGVAAAAVELAKAQVNGLEIGATDEQIAAVEARVEIARAALGALRVQQDQLALQAPVTGFVLERPVQLGELALPGAPLMTLADLDKVTLTVYVPEGQLGKVRVGQSVSVTVDAYPGRTFEGTVAHIASQAEFTPKNVQTREERVNMVFAVKAALPNPDHALKPGMPADAVFAEISMAE